MCFCSWWPFTDSIISTCWFFLRSDDAYIDSFGKNVCHMSFSEEILVLIYFLFMSTGQITCPFLIELDFWNIALWYLLKLSYVCHLACVWVVFQTTVYAFVTVKGQRWVDIMLKVTTFFQCSNDSCRVAYHPLCARASGLCVEVLSYLAHKWYSKHS